MCSREGSHLLDRSLLKEGNKGISSRYVNVNLQGEREKKKTNTEATGKVSTDFAITGNDRVREWDGESN